MPSHNHYKGDEETNDLSIFLSRYSRFYLLYRRARDSLYTVGDVRKTSMMRDFRPF